MSELHDESPALSVRFKKRRIVHPKRVFSEEETPEPSSSHGAFTPPAQDASSLHKEATNDEEETGLNLKEILRNRKRPRERLKEVARKTENSNTELAAFEGPRPDQYTSRFVGQTGQVVDRDDEQMTEYVEARMAEKNFRKYAWPIPVHLQASVAAIAPDLKHSFTTAPSTSTASTGSDTLANVEHSNRLATGQGKLQEVDLGPDATAHRKPETENRARRDKYGYSWRNPKRRNSEDARRDQMVEAVLREAKLDYFDDSAPAEMHQNGSGDNDEAIAERFRMEYMESMEEARQQRKAPPPAGGVKGVKEAPKGPKLGGSKSARARILKAQEEEKKTGKR